MKKARASPPRAARAVPKSFMAFSVAFGRLAGVGCAIVSMLALVCACSGKPSPVGDPDPGHRSLATLVSVLSVIPRGAHVTQEDKVEPRWDSCDGRQSTYGWDPVYADAEFSTSALSPQQVIAHVRAAMTRLAWAYSATDSRDGQWLWLRQVGGQTATMTLQSDMDGDPRMWSLRAQAPPATHPVTGC
jgi:hypothetical protein